MNSQLAAVLHSSSTKNLRRPLACVSDLHLDGQAEPGIEALASHFQRGAYGRASLGK